MDPQMDTFEIEKVQFIIPPTCCNESFAVGFSCPFGDAGHHWRIQPSVLGEANLAK